MFGRKKKQQDQMRAFAQQTIDTKYSLINGVTSLFDGEGWFENGKNAAGKAALSSYLRYLGETENVVYLTVNSLSPAMDARAREAADSVAHIMLGGTLPGLGSPPFIAHNALQRDVFGIDPFEDGPSDTRAADGALALGFMITCKPENFSSIEACLQQITVACALAAGWAQSPQRATLPPR